MCVRYVRAKESVSRHEMRRLALRDALAARGLPLGGSERAWASMPHDGMRMLADLVAPGQSVAMGNESAGGALQRLEVSMRNAASLVSPCFSNGVLALNRCAPPQEVPPLFRVRTWRLPLVLASGPPAVADAISDRGAAATLFSDR